ncbi:MAG: hypothetical protein K6A42_08765 [Treponema sp.]|nr:hypothetical protein [Treponema sp.]
MKKNLLAVAALCALALFSCKNSSDSPVIPFPPAPQVKTSDWLFLCYFDADDSNINDDLYKNIRDIECAFAQTRNADGSPKAGYAKVTALVLWDGISEEKKGGQQFIHPDGALYEIGADYSLSYVPQSGNEYGAGYVQLGNGFSVGPNTRDLTAQAAGWLPKEPAMSDPATLTYFLKWAKARYSASNVVVCLQDHGAGTHKETYTDSNASMISASLCSDASDDTGRLLTCKNITDALSAAGYTGTDKPKILWNDLCLQATAEILWNYKGCADYYCASANVSCMPDYYGVFTNIKSGMTALDVGKVIVSAYMHRYYAWPIEQPADAESAKDSRSSGCSVYTSSFMSLDPQKALALKAGVDKLSDELLKIKENDSNLFYSIFLNYMAQDVNSLGNCKGLAYCGTFAWLNDLGWLCLDIANDASLPAAAKESALSLFELLKNGDDKLIIYSWGGRRVLKNAQDGYSWGDTYLEQLYLTGKKDFISQKTVATVEETCAYGLSIVGSKWTNATEQNNPIFHYVDWTGFSESWGKVIKAWWNLYKS